MLGILYAGRCVEEVKMEAGSHAGGLLPQARERGISDLESQCED